MATAITFSALTYSGTASADDQLAARHITFLKNQEIAAENARRAALTPPGTPLVLWPVASGAELKASYLAILLSIVSAAHLSYIEQAKSASGVQARFTEAELAQIRANLVARLNAGESVASVITDTAA